MKYLISMLILFPNLAFAGNWMSGPHIIAAKAKSGTAITYWEKSTCERKETPPCYDIDGKDLRRWQLINDELVTDTSGSTDADTEDAAKLQKELDAASRFTRLKNACATETGVIQDICRHLTD